MPDIPEFQYVGRQLQFVTNSAKFGRSGNIFINGKGLTDNDKAILMTYLREMTLKQLKLLGKNLILCLLVLQRKLKLLTECLLWHVLG